MHPRRAARLASCFAMSNLGLEQYIPTDVSHGIWRDDPLSDMCDIGGHVIESDEHEIIFCEEAENWFDNFKHLTIEETKEQYHWNIGRPWFDAILSIPEEELEKMR